MMAGGTRSSLKHLVGLPISQTFEVASYPVFPLPGINKKATSAQVKMPLIQYLSCSLDLVIPLILT